MSDAALAAPVLGFFGKLPSRGDFVRAGLPRRFIEPWDAWLQDMLPSSRAALGSRWLDAWMVAPVWRFALASGICGPEAASGVLLPSVDRAGRHFPLTIAMVGDSLAPDDWFAFAEDAGRAALEQDETPDILTARLATFRGRRRARMTEPEGAAAWWSDGSPYVQATRILLAGLPDARMFASMLATSEAAQ